MSNAIYQRRATKLTNASSIHLIGRLLLIAVVQISLLLIPAAVFGGGQPAQTKVNKFLATLNIAPPGYRTSHTATPSPAQSSGAISGTDFEIAVYCQWQPVGHPFVDPNGLNSIRLEVSGTAADGTRIFGQVVASHDWSNVQGKHPIWWEIGARIDTTQFKSGSYLTIYATGAAADPGWQNIPNSWKFLVNNGVLENGNNQLYNWWVNAVRLSQGKYTNAYLDQLNGMNLYLDSPPFSQWKGIPDYVSGNEGLVSYDLEYFIAQFSVFNILTHGNIAEFTGVMGNPDTAADVVTARTVAHLVSSKSIMQSPYTFVYLSACNVMGDIIFGNDYKIHRPAFDTRMAAAFLEGNEIANLPNESNPFDRDRAVLGYQYEVGCGADQAIFAENMTNFLMHGIPLYDAINSAASLGPQPKCVTGGAFDKKKQEVIIKTEVFTPLVPTIEGDKYMTLHGLYLHGLPNDTFPFADWFHMDDDQPYTGPE